MLSPINISKEHKEIVSKIIKLDDRLKIDQNKNNYCNIGLAQIKFNVNTQTSISEANININPQNSNFNLNMNENIKTNSQNLSIAEKCENIERRDNKLKSHKVKENYKVNISSDRNENLPDNLQNFENIALSSIRSSINTSDLKDDLFSSRYTKNKELIIAINPKQTHIHKVLKINDNDIKINKTSLSYLNESK